MKTNPNPSPSTRFKPGQSGNPSGKPKITASERELIELCKEQGPAAVATLTELMVTGDDRTRVTCAQILLDRGYGKPRQAVTISGDAENPIVHELIMGPRQETLVEWQARRQAMLNNITTKVIEHGSKEEKRNQERH